MDGWIKVHRKILNSDVWYNADAEGKVILLTILLRASHAPTRWQVSPSKTVGLNPGQLFITLRTFAVKCGVSVKKLSTELKRLTVAGFIDTFVNRDGTIVTVRNWARYQSAETPLETPLETQTETPANADTARLSPSCAATMETQMETPKGTVLETHNKIYILIKNKYNKTDLNKTMLLKASKDAEYKRALELYCDMYPDKENSLSDTDMYNLNVIAALLGSNWINRAVYELKAAQHEKQIKNPAKYLLGILQNWLENGIPNDSKGKKRELLDFYEEAGIT